MYIYIICSTIVVCIYYYDDQLRKCVSYINVYSIYIHTYIYICNIRKNDPKMIPKLKPRLIKCFMHGPIYNKIYI